MDTSFISPLQFCLKKLLPFAFSFLDDALLLLLPRFGLHLGGLQWLSTVLLLCTVLYWVIKFFYSRYRASLAH